MDATEDEFTGRPELLSKRARAIFWERLGIAMTILYCLISLTAIVLLAAQGARQRDILLECTTPGGECFERGRQANAQRRDDVNAYTKNVVRIAVICASKPGNAGNEDAITKCIDDGLEESPSN